MLPFHKSAALRPVGMIQQASAETTVAAEGCTFPQFPARLSDDFARFPEQDFYGNQIVTSEYLKSALYARYGISFDPEGIGNAYQVGLASWNAADSAAKRKRLSKNGCPLPAWPPSQTLRCSRRFGMEG